MRPSQPAPPVDPHAPHERHGSHGGARSKTGWLAVDPVALGLCLSFPALIWLTSLHPDYGYFIDELDYLACALRPAFGYVDHPPLAPLLLGAQVSLLGDAQPVIRILPALCGAVVMTLAAGLAMRLGGGRYAQVLAALCVVMAPVFMGVFSFYSTNCFELVCWTLAFGVLMELSRSRDARLWVWLGALLGISILFKHTSLLLAAAVGLALLLSPQRRQLLDRHLWYGVALALLIVIPNLVWQMQHDWASLTFYTESDRLGNVASSPLSVLGEQIGSFNPAAAPVWLAGLWFLIGSRRGRPYRLVGWVMAVLFIALLAAGKSRPDRIMGVYPTLFAVGAVQLEAFATTRRTRWIRYALPVLLLGVGLGLAPALIPILSPASAIRHTRALSEENELQREVGQAPLLLPLAHRMGSPELVRVVARVREGLESALRSDAVVLAAGYASAGALEVLGGENVAPVYSPHVTYYFWGPPPEVEAPVIAVGYEAEQLAPYFERVVVVDRALCAECMGWRQEVPIALATGRQRPWEELWPELRLESLPGRKLYLLERAGGP